jgi:CubicO group peptidase (beta-lactamase class C family)
MEWPCFRSSRVRTRLILVSFVALLAGCAHAPLRPATLTPNDYGPAVGYLSELIRAEMRQHAITGLSVAIVDDQRVVWAQGFGLSDKGHAVEATPQTVYRVGSISKLFTDTAAMQLKDQGRLELDAPIERAVPDLVVRSRFPHTVTPRNLMSHHSGLVRDLPGTFTETSKRSLLEQLAQSDAIAPADLVFGYSNPGIALLGHAIEEVSGRPFAEQLATSLLEPLGMHDSSFDAQVSSSALMSRGYADGKEVNAMPVNGAEPAGGLSSSVTDLSRFLQMLFADGRVGDRQLVSGESIAEMFEPQNTKVPLDLDFRIGLGWFIGPSIGDAKVVSHGGWLPPFVSAMSAVPSHKLGVVVLANSGAIESVERIAREALEVALEVKTGSRTPATTPPQEADGVQFTPKELVGTYATIRGLARVEERAGHFVARLKGRELHLLPGGEGTLSLEYRWLGIFPVKVQPADLRLSLATIAGRHVIVARVGERHVLFGERVEHMPELGRWRERLGDYELASQAPGATPTRGTLAEVEGELVADVGGQRYEFLPVSDDLAVEVGALVGVGEVLRPVDEREGGGLHYKGFHFIKRSR